MKAHEIEYGTKVRIVDEDVKVPPAAIPLKKDDIITIFKVDGMYCNGSDGSGNRIYLSAWTEVEELN